MEFSGFFMSSILERIKQKETKTLIVMFQTSLRAEEHSVAVDLWHVFVMSAENKYLQTLMCLSSHRDQHDLQRSCRSERIAHKCTCSEFAYNELSTVWYLIWAHS
jgi:hypothetical protein